MAKNAKTAQDTIQTVLASQFLHTLLGRGLGTRASRGKAGKNMFPAIYVRVQTDMLPPESASPF